MTGEKGLVSVIVPVYNAEAFVERTIRSVRAQAHEEIELILVDDGSSDGSGAICDRHAREDARIRVIHQQNAGPAAARDAGLDAATGEYVTFCDGDDWVEREWVSRMLASLGDADICACRFLTETPDNPRKAELSACALGRLELTREEAFYRVFEEKRRIGPFLWNKLIRRDVIEKAHVRFPKGVFWGEDAAFVAACVQGARKVVSIQDRLYHYVINEKSIVHARFDHKYLTVLDAYRQIAGIGEALGLRGVAEVHGCTKAAGLLNRYVSAGADDRAALEAAKRYLKERRGWLLRDKSHSLRARAFCLMLSCNVRGTIRLGKVLKLIH